MSFEYVHTLHERHIRNLAFQKSCSGAMGRSARAERLPIAIMLRPFDRNSIVVAAVLLQHFANILDTGPNCHQGTYLYCTRSNAQLTFNPELKGDYSTLPSC